jgi:hypothetical protein
LANIIGGKGHWKEWKGLNGERKGGGGNGNIFGDSNKMRKNKVHSWYEFCPFIPPKGAHGVWEINVF